jgi:high-affinity Fe2+/Pb2+ permease
MIQRIVATLLGVLLFALVFLFVSVFLALAVTAGLLLGGWVWWRSRRQRRRVIEGEYRIIESR